MIHCKTMQDVRANINRLDDLIVPLLAERAGFVAQAARIKQDRSKVVDTDRIEEVITRVRHLANENGVDPNLIEAIYREMINAYIVFETHEWTRLHGHGGPAEGP